ncbi:unnamed protein product [Staurois parvus]|uniref:Uncharacterized protein n=1 Tax=Staurois parvus TaxID=386267 RepID=A0ABN9DA72_9NEOB|nr:unnamed protein product [Staurois parvus]
MGVWQKLFWMQQDVNSKMTAIRLSGKMENCPLEIQ